MDPFTQLRLPLLTLGQTKPLTVVSLELVRQFSPPCFCCCLVCYHSVPLRSLLLPSSLGAHVCLAHKLATPPMPSNPTVSRPSSHFASFPLSVVAKFHCFLSFLLKSVLPCISTQRLQPKTHRHGSVTLKSTIVKNDLILSPSDFLSSFSTYLGNGQRCLCKDVHCRVLYNRE